MILDPTRHWECPNCALTDVTTKPVANRYHPCAGLNGILAPMIPAGTRAKVTAVEREDYIGDEMVQLAPNGRPFLSVFTERPDGSNDVMVMAPSATGEGSANGLD
jgi:hypothetical protein